MSITSLRKIQRNCEWSKIYENNPSLLIVWIFLMFYRLCVCVCEREREREVPGEFFVDCLECDSNLLQTIASDHQSSKKCIDSMSTNSFVVKLEKRKLTFCLRFFSSFTEKIGKHLNVYFFNYVQYWELKVYSFETKMSSTFIESNEYRRIG